MGVTMHQLLKTLVDQGGTEFFSNVLQWAL